MKNCIWTTDIHLKHSNLDVTDKLFHFLEQTITEKKAENLVITGDINDTKSIIRSECLIQFRSFLKKIDIPVWLLVGNHDMHNTRKPELGHALETFKDIPNVTVIDKPKIIDKNIKFIPYIDDINELRKEIKKDSVEFLFCHNGISGAEMNTKGTFDDFSISSDNFKKIKNVFVGHYHNAHALENILYLGSPFSHSFNEANVEKYIAYIDFEDQKGEFVHFIPTNLRHHISIEINSDKEKNLKDKIKFNEGDIVRIVIEGKKENNQLILEKLNKLNIDAKIIVKNKNQKKKRMKLDNTSTRKDILREYLKKVDVDLDANKIKQIGEDLLSA